MTKGISLKLDLDLLEETEELAKAGGTSRNKYINMAIKSYNKKRRREEMKRLLKIASEKCRDESMQVLNEFERLEDDFDAI